MFGFRRRPGPRPLTDAVRRAIEEDGLPAPVVNLSLLWMVESKGRFSDRNVTYFHVFDSTSPVQRALDIRRYQDFDVFSGLILRSGHVERDGTIALNRSEIVRAAEAP